MASVRLKRHQFEREDLPLVCARCGAPATTHTRKKFSWYPPWINVLILAGLLPWLIVAMVLRKEMSVKVPFCDVHRYHWLYRTLAVVASIVLLLAAGVGAMALAAELEHSARYRGAAGWACFGWVVLAIVWLIGVIIVNVTAIHPTEITDETITLAGLADGFVEAVEQSPPLALPAEPNEQFYRR